MNEHKFLVNKQYEYDEYLETLYKLNYNDDKQYPPDHRYSFVLNWTDLWFHLVRGTDIIACCSVKITDNIYQIDDVFVEEQFKGNNYAFLLLINVIIYIKEINENNIIEICGHISNSPAIITYRKLFGKPYKITEDKEYFHL
jgi:GNAT superfamily N-acetyltransferase